MSQDLLLSSGFLAFARHVGVLRGIEEVGVPIDAIVGTSSGALIGALWAAGMPATQIATWIGARRPLAFMTPHLRPWDGVFHLQPLLDWLGDHLPARFEDLPRPFAAGVIGPGRVPRLLVAGPLVPAVAASCAIPYLFRPVEHEGVRYQDGGVADRLMLGPWRAWRGQRSALAHIIDRTAGVDTTADLTGVRVLRSPRSGATFWSLGDVAAAVEDARVRTVQSWRPRPDA